MNFAGIPGRTFLDTSCVNFILEHGECIFDGVTPPKQLSGRIIEDINALYNIFLTGKRASWQLAVSPATYEEIINTQDSTKRHYLENWFMDVWHYWRSILEEGHDLPSSVESRLTRIKLLSSGILNMLPDAEDRMLLCDAIGYKCDCFCTRDWYTILKHRDMLASLPISILTPTEWWKLVRPYAGLWV
jgi:hypothetical protein